MIKIKAKIRSNSTAIPRIFNADVDYSGLKLIRHDLCRGSLAQSTVLPMYLRIMESCVVYVKDGAGIGF